MNKPEYESRWGVEERQLKTQRLQFSLHALQEAYGQVRGNPELSTRDEILQDVEDMQKLLETAIYSLTKQSDNLSEDEISSLEDRTDNLITTLGKWIK